MSSILAIENSVADQFMEQVSQSWGVSVEVVAAILIVLMVWELCWRLAGMWKAAAKKKSLTWFIILAIVNTLGILSILYIFWFSKIGEKKEMKVSRKPAKRKRR